MRLVAPEGLTPLERIQWYDVPENVSHYIYGTRGGWEKRSTPVLGWPKWIGTCWDMSVLKKDGLYQMWFSWRPHQGIGYTTSKDGVNWDVCQLVLGPQENSPYEADEVTRPSVIYKDGQYHMWYSGHIRPYLEGGVSNVSYACSTDGIHWERPYDKPVMEADQDWEKGSLMGPCVIFDEENNLYKLWYSAGSNHEPDAINYAESKDGIHWVKHEGPILTSDPANEWEQHKVTGPLVVKHDGWYYMFYIGHMHEERGSIGLARSRNGIDHWEKHPQNPIIAPEHEGFDSVSVYKPYVMKDEKGWTMWYNGAEFDEPIWVYESIGYVRHPGDDLWE